MNQPPLFELTAADLAEAADLGATVTIGLETDSGVSYVTGTLRLHRTEPGVYTLHTGQRGRPRVIHPDDVESVIYE